MKATPVDIARTFLMLRSRDGDVADPNAERLTVVFQMLSEFSDGGLFASSFSGYSPWEQHPGDELVLIVEGRTDLILFSEQGESRNSLSAGQLIVVPAHTWHRFETFGPVDVLGVTPQPTKTSTEPIPPMDD
ncbi:MAG: cupin domain-containing protein [Pseudomonadota bacterium]